MSGAATSLRTFPSPIPGLVKGMERRREGQLQAGDKA